MKILRDRAFWLGLLPPFVIGLVATGVGRVAPTLGAPVVGIILGLIIGQFLGQPAAIATGTKFCAKRVLQASIVLLGAGLSLPVIARVGLAGLPVLIGTIIVVVGLGLPLTRLLKVEEETGKLVTYGTSICGASAIATMSQVMGAAPTAVAVSIAVIVVYNVAAAILFPYLGHLIGLSPESFGLWAGTAVNDTSSVVAASTSYDQILLHMGIGGGVAAGTAVVVKLTRTLGLIPLSLFEQWLTRRRNPDAHPNTKWYRLVPPFLVLFLIAAAINSLGVIPESAAPVIKFIAHYGTTVAMTAVGMSSSFRQIRDAGWRPLALGGILWLAIIAASIALQWATGQWNMLG
ncbi:YeiH family protein [Enemella sp. A6]|uniref:YeiH family protein n=1 Tax=Enemella sp. A6 TaxID=3440152 RepID=UPI003EBB6D3A